MFFFFFIFTNVCNTCPWHETNKRPGLVKAFLYCAHTTAQLTVLLSHLRFSWPALTRLRFLKNCSRRCDDGEVQTSCRIGSWLRWLELRLKEGSLSSEYKHHRYVDEVFPSWLDWKAQWSLLIETAGRGRVWSLAALLTMSSLTQKKHYFPHLTINKYTK